MKSVVLIIGFVLTIICVTLLLKVPGPAMAQKKPDDYFYKGVELAKGSKDHYYEAIEAFNNIDTTSDLYTAAFYNIGYLHFLLNDDTTAIKVFQQILRSDFDDVYNPDADDGIVDSPHTMNCKHRAANSLSLIFFKQEKFDSALYYYAISDTVYPYGASCCDQLSDRKINCALRYADIYQNLDRNDLAIQALLDVIFPMRTDNSEIIARLQTLLGKESIRGNIKREFDSSLLNIYTITHKSEEGYEWTWYFFRFRGKEVAIPESYGYRYPENKEPFDAAPPRLNDHFEDRLARAKIRKTPFYQMVRQL